MKEFIYYFRKRTCTIGPDLLRPAQVSKTINSKFKEDLLKVKGKLYNWLVRQSVFKFLNAIRPAFFSGDKNFRTDLHLYEQEFIFFWLLRWYSYSVWKQGRLHTKIKLLKIQPETAEYFYFHELPPIRVGRVELAERYQNNKWLVPINYQLDLSIP